MAYEKVVSATGRAKCTGCKEPIIKKEGAAKWSWGYLCYKCSKAYLDKVITYWKNERARLDVRNKVSERRMNELKIAKMV